MSEIVMLEISNALAQRARSVAQQTQRQVEEVLIEWLDRAATELPIDLLARQREGRLPNSERGRLDILMDSY
jgi:hypothetical protein